MSGLPQNRRESMVGLPPAARPPSTGRQRELSSLPPSTSGRRESLHAGSMAPPPPRHPLAAAPQPSGVMGPPPPPLTRRESLPGTMGPPPAVPKLRLSELGSLPPRSAADPGGDSAMPGKSGAWALPPPLPSARSVRAAAQVPLPDSKEPFSALTTPRTPGFNSSQATARSPLLGSTASPLPTGAQPRGGAAPHPDVSRAETKVLRIQELQLRYINARMKNSLAVRTSKVRISEGREAQVRTRESELRKG